MPRYKITIEYDGTHLVGWQRQKNGLSVQSLLEEAIYRFSGEGALTHGAGRTDAGVHARGQVAHFDLERPWEADRIRSAMNAYLRDLSKPCAVSILTVEEVDETFHARFSALSRSYEYRIINRPAPLILDQSQAWWVYKPLNIQAMQEASTLLLGTHDFSSFRDSQCQASSPIKTLDQFDISKKGQVFLVEVKAKSFLHHQVRNMVGTLVLVGTGKWNIQDFAHARDAKDRRQAGPTAPAAGLTFMDVIY